MFALPLESSLRSLILGVDVRQCAHHASPLAGGAITRFALDSVNQSRATRRCADFPAKPR